MPHSHLKLRDLRIAEHGKRESFEEFCCQIFRRAPEAPADSRYRRVRGDGGDGGVEAFWTFPCGDVWGIQAKFFDTLGASQKAQLTDSVRQAAANYPNLKRYTICLPMNLTAKTGAKAGKPKHGQHEKLTEWIDEWRAKLVRVGRSVSFEVWDESELLGRLASADTTGGLVRYWFDNDALTPAWFTERLAEAKAQAGPRYSPELTVATPLDDALQAFGRSELWVARIERIANTFSDKLEWWRKTAGGNIEPISSSPKELAGEANAVLAAAEPLEQNLSLAGENPEVLTLPSFRDAVRLSISRGNGLEPKLKQALLAKYGDGADSPGFRQWRAEYMVDFPMAPLDHLRELLSALAEVEVLAFQPEGQLPAATAMLLRGEAGIGKTHGIVDAANRRNGSSRLSLIFFGEDVTGPDPWQPFIAKLGLGNAEGRDAVLDALNAAGEATGFPLVIFIDALNETQPDRQRWQSWLPPMLEQIRRRPFLKLCVSCREIYVHEVMPPGLSVPTIVHNGFLGREYEAQFAFFQHYGLGVPAEPLLQEEFSSPLFLRLVCEALRGNQAQAIPAGRDGIRAIINLLMRAKNDRAASQCDFDRRENRVCTAMLGLAGAMACAGSRTLPLAEAKALVDGPLSVLSQSLFAVLEAESLIAIIEQTPTDLGAEPQYSVRFTFERIGDHLIAEHLLATVTDVATAFAVGGPLHFVVVDDDAARANAGILEALSIQLPEARGIELIDIVVTIDRSLLWNALIAGLQWRNPEFISTRTVQLVHEGFGSTKTGGATFEALLGLAARPDHPLNAHFLDRQLDPVPMLARDPFWAYTLEQSYSEWSNTVRPKSGVHRLIEMARRGKLDALPDAVGVLWAMTLAWFCASPDRRIRDRASIAMVCIFRARPGTIAPLLSRYALSEDEYISERVVVAAYGALLLNQSAPDLQKAAGVVYELYFADRDPPLNVSLRDHARLIIEMSVELGVPPPGLNVALYRPPYRSAWPITIPNADDVKPYAEDTKRFPHMDLEERFGFALGTDFARYIVEPRVTRAFDIEKAKLDKLGIFRWFLKEAAEFGYPGPDDKCARYDRALVGKFGGGRGKPGWAERLGKKYYWIFLRQLVGRLSDHLDRKSWSKSFPPCAEPQGLDLRDIDPSDLRQFLPPPFEDDSWLTPAPYLFQGRDTSDGDAAWIEKDDLTDVSLALVLTDANGIAWQAIDTDASWNGRRASRRADTYRHISRSVRAATCDAADMIKVKKAFAEVGLDHFNSGPHDYRGYLGEYPARWPYASRRFDPIMFESKDAGIRFQTLTLRQLRGREWEYDYSQVGESPSLLMPSIELVQAGGLRWDHRGGWYDADRKIQIQDPWWWSGDDSAALLCRVEYLDRFLEQSNRALVILGFQTKFIAGMTAGPGRVTERTLFIRHHGNVMFIDRKLVKD